jgi:hypothetical protein
MNRPASDLGHGTEISRLWPERILGPRPGLREVNLVCWAMLIAFLLAPICVVRGTQMLHGGISIRQLDSDFIYLYGDGQIAARYPAARIYDYQLQQQVYTAILPKRDGGFYGPSPYPPFVILFFEPFTHLSFGTAYLLWMSMSLLLYLCGIGATLKAVFPDARLQSSLLLCLSLAFYPFIFTTLMNGQLASVAVCSIGLAIYQEEQGNAFRSGLALGLLAYKPTLLPLLLLFLVLTRRFKALSGFITTAAILILAATALAGREVWWAYAYMLHSFGHIAGMGGASQVQLWTHVDLGSFFDAIPVGTSIAGRTVLAAIFAVSLGALVVLFWMSRTRGKPAQWLAWAGTLTWTLLLNVYAPIYDSVLVVIAVILMLGALRDLGWRIATEWTILLAVMIFVVSWITEPIAKAYGVQLLTMLLLLLGSVQLVFLHQAIRQPEAWTALREA